MDPIILISWFLLWVWMLSSGGSRQAPAPSVVVMANQPNRDQSSASEVFVIGLLVILYLLGTALPS